MSGDLMPTQPGGLHVYVCRKFGNTEQISGELIEYIKGFADAAGKDYFK